MGFARARMRRLKEKVGSNPHPHIHRVKRFRRIEMRNPHAYDFDPLAFSSFIPGEPVLCARARTRIYTYILERACNTRIRTELCIIQTHTNHASARI